MYSLAIDPALVQEAQSAFLGRGIDIEEAVTGFLRNSIREMKRSDSLTEADLVAKHLRGLAEIDAGGGIHKTLAELEAMAEDE